MEKLGNVPANCSYSKGLWKFANSPNIGVFNMLSISKLMVKRGMNRKILCVDFKREP